MTPAPHTHEQLANPKLWTSAAPCVERERWRESGSDTSSRRRAALERVPDAYRIGSNGNYGIFGRVMGMVMGRGAHL